MSTPTLLSSPAARTGELTARDLQKYALQGFSNPLPRLGSATLQAFLSLQPERPKVLLFTDKPQTPPLFQALAANLEPLGLLFADVAAQDAGVLQQFGVEKVLALFFLPVSLPRIAMTDVSHLSWLVVCVATRSLR